MHKWRTIILFLPAAIAAAQQGTRVDLGNQGRNLVLPSSGSITNVDFSQVVTKPAQTGTGAPALPCNAGQVYFRLDATAGQNLYLCSQGSGGVNAWSPIASSGGSGGGSGTTSSAGLTDLGAALTAANVLTIASTCTISTPCNVRFGGKTIPITNSGSLTLPSGFLVGGSATIYLASDGSLNAISTIGPSPVQVSGINLTSNTQVPSDGIPLAVWTASAGISGTPAWISGTDLRAFISNRSSILQGTGIVVADSTAGQLIISADTSVVGVRVAPPATSSAACSTGNYAADGGFFYQCVAPGTWLRVALSTW